MRPLHVVVPGSITQRTGGYRYDARVVGELRAAGRQVRVHELDDGFPYPTEKARQRAARLFSAMPDGALVMTDALAGSVLPEVMAHEAERLELIALVHHPLALETGMDAAEARRLAGDERRALSYARHVIVTSSATADALRSDYDVADERLTIAEPGTDTAPIATGSGAGTVSRLLCVATLTPRKGHEVLLDAFAMVLQAVPHRMLQLDLIGCDTRAPRTTTAITRQIERLGLAKQVTVHGETDAMTLDAHYAQSDALVLASYHEGFGMVLTEALARGLPIVATRGGAIADTVSADAALLVDAGDAEALGEALLRLVSDADLYRQLRGAALHARQRLTSWQASASTITGVLEGLST